MMRSVRSDRLRRSEIVRKGTVLACAALLTAAGISAVQVSAVAAQDTVVTAQGDTLRGTVHVVQKGDTLWDLSERYMNSPWVWPRVYEANQATIANPHLIYPGQLVLFPVGGGQPLVLSFEEVWPGPATERDQLTRQALAFTTEPAEPAEPAEPSEPTPTEEEPMVQTGEVSGNTLRVEERAPTPLASASVVLESGFIGEPDDWPVWEIIDGENADFNMSVYNKVYIDVDEEEAHPGDLFIVIERGPRVRHPEWGHYLGRKILVKGVVRIDAVEGRTSQGELVAVYGAVHRGDRVLPAPYVDTRPWTGFVPVQGGREGFVVARAKPEGNLHPYDMLFVDGGNEEGVRVGDLYAIRRPEEERGRLRFFEEELGRAVVLAVEETTATMMILDLHTPEINVGEKVILVGRSVFETSPPGR
jgi:hypothetical protein